MPELPDVELYRRHLEETSLNRTLARVEVLNAKILQGITANKLATRLKGRRFVEGRRHGKRLLARLDDAGWLTLHFGMTGRLQYYIDPAEEPAYDRLRFDFEDGSHLAYVNMRLLGRVGLAEDFGRFVAEAELGPDVLDPGFDFAAFEKVLSAKRSSLKAMLMDQGLLAGIGNIYSDEILFQARLHPLTKPCRLDARARKRLFGAIKEVLETAVKRGAGSEQFLERLPRDYLLPHREAAGLCPRCGRALEKIKVGGRSGYLCPRCQRGADGAGAG